MCTDASVAARAASHVIALAATQEQTWRTCGLRSTHCVPHVSCTMRRPPLRSNRPLRTSYPLGGRPKRPRQSARICRTHPVAWLVSCSVALFQLVHCAHPLRSLAPATAVLVRLGGFPDPMSPARCPETDCLCPWQQASDWTRWMVRQAGGDSTRFSGISARKGGISAAIEECVPKAIPYLQSGHCQALPAHVHEPHVPGTLTRNVRGLRPLIGPSSKPFTHVVSFLGSESVACWWGEEGPLSLGLGWDGGSLPSCGP